jgi:hypothetical protein
MGMTINGSSGLIFPDSTTMATGSQAVRAWVNFNGTGTVAIRASYNVTSITDGGTGTYTLNFTTAMPDANYCVTGICTTPGSTVGPISAPLSSAGNQTTTALAVGTFTTAGGLFDASFVNVAVFD